MVYARAIRGVGGAILDAYAIEAADHPARRPKRRREADPDAVPPSADRASNLDPAILDLVMAAVRFSVEQDGLWSLASDDELAEAAGLDVPTVAEALAELDRLGRVGVLDHRHEVEGRCLWMPDGPRADEVARLRGQILKGHVMPPKGPAEPRREPMRFIPPFRGNPLAIAMMPTLVPWCPPVSLVPGLTCQHDVRPFPKGSHFVCLVCHRSGLDGIVDAVGRRQSREAAAMAESYRAYPAEIPTEDAKGLGPIRRGRSRAG